jgi:Family of unknown function (DUF5989)
MDDDSKSEFEKVSSQVGDAGVVHEFWLFLKHNKKWWLLPIIGVLLVLGLLIVLSSTAAAPFIYTLF